MHTDVLKLACLNEYEAVDYSKPADGQHNSTQDNVYYSSIPSQERVTSTAAIALPHNSNKEQQLIKNLANPLAYEFFFFAGSIEVVCLLFAGMSYFYKYVDPNLLSPSFTSDLRVDQDVPKDGRENRSLMRERESPPPPYYGDDMMATSDVDDTSQP